MKYGISKTTTLSFAEAVERATIELKKEGFGILTTIDVKETMKTKLGVDFENYIILGACNPLFAHRALLAEEQIGLLLPCNVIVYERNGTTNISIFDPATMSLLVDNRELNSIAVELREKLERVLHAV
jgi:uncharacterized protein (DUF302 family)